MKTEDKTGVMSKKKMFYMLLFFEAVIIFLVHIFNINKLYGFYLSEDELGYWGNAAFMLGKGWGNVLETCAYYSPGYSFFLMLIMKLPIKPLTMYHLAIAANALFMVGVFYISSYLFMELFPQRNKAFVSISCMAMALYASYITQSSIAWSECFLTFVVWLILLQAYLICKKITITRVLIFAVEVVYLYTIHQRTVGVLIAGIAFIVYMIKHRKMSVKSLIVTVVVMGCMFFATVILKKHMISAAYISGNIGNTWSHTLKYVNFSKLFIPTIKEACGQLFYLWVTSFGIVPLGIAATVWTCINNWKKKNDICYYAGFVLLAFLGVFAVSCVWIGYIITPNAVDFFMYGRLNEIISGFFIVSGFMVLPDFVVQKKGRRILWIASIVFIGLATVLFYRVRQELLTDSYLGVSAPGLYWFYLMGGEEVRVWELVVMILAVFFLLFESCRRLADKKWIFMVEVTAILLFWIWSGEQVIQNQIIPYQLITNYDMIVKKDILQYIINSDDVVFFSDSELSNRGTIQFYMQDKPLKCIIKTKSLDEELDENPDILIMDNSANNSESKVDVLKGYYLMGTLSGKTVYSSKEIGMDRSMFSFNQIGSEESGYVMFGPYISLNPGYYEVTLHMNENPALRSEAVLGVADIVAEGGSSTISSVEWDGTSQSITMQFYLQKETDNIEIRYFKNEGNAAIPLELTLKIIDEQK